MIIGITDRHLYENETVYLEMIGSFLQSDQIDYLILREPDFKESDYSEFVGRIVAMIDSLIEVDKRKKVMNKLVVHTYMNVANKYSISRLHLPQRLIGQVRELSNQYKVSYSYHPVRENDLGDGENKAEFVLISPIFSTTCKPGAVPMDKVLLMGLKDHWGDKLVLLG